MKVKYLTSQWRPIFFKYKPLSGSLPFITSNGSGIFAFFPVTNFPMQSSWLNVFLSIIQIIVLHWQHQGPILFYTSSWLSQFWPYFNFHKNVSILLALVKTAPIFWRARKTWRPLVECIFLDFLSTVSL